jgi:hypothetical protein
MARPRLVSVRGPGALWGALMCLAACTSPNSSPRPPPPAPAAPPPAPAVVYDWHPLLLAPLGTWFRDMPVPLTEVIQFHESGESASGEECFKPKDTDPPRFLDRAPADYLLCFMGDRLSRIEAAVHVPPEQASALFLAACADWERRAKAGPTTAESCEGREEDIAFSARLVAAATAEQDPAAAVAPPAPAASVISISLTRVAP